MTDEWQIVIRGDGLAECSRADKRWVIGATWGIINGRPEPIAVTIARPQVEPLDVPPILNAVAIRSIPIGRALNALRQAGDARRYAEQRLSEIEELHAEAEALYHEMASFGGPTAALADEVDELERSAAEHGELLEATRGPQRGRPRTRFDHQAVADVYRHAYERGTPVQQAVAEAFHVSRSTAGKRIMAARKAGLLEGIGRSK
jgi:hypothetical protein